VADFGNTVTDADNGGLPGSVQKSAAVVCDNPATFPASSNGKGLLKIAGKQSAARWHRVSGKGL